MTLKTIQLDIEGMSCVHCENAVANILKELKGVTDSSVNLLQHTAEITYDSDKISQQQIVDAINATQVYKAKA